MKRSENANRYAREAARAFALAVAAPPPGNRRRTALLLLDILVLSDTDLNIKVLRNIVA